MVYKRGLLYSCLRLAEQSAAFASRIPAVVPPAEDAIPQRRGLGQTADAHMMDWLHEKAILSESVVPELVAELKSLGAFSVQELAGGRLVGAYLLVVLAVFRAAPSNHVNTIVVVY